MSAPQTLPKKRAAIPSDRTASNVPPIRQPTGSTSGAIATPSGNRIISNRVILNRRHVSRSNNANALPGSGVGVSVDESPNDSSLLEDNNIGFNENKHIIMSNFEEWIRMATDNKITLKNSWNFDLIDYFHDLNVIKDGESINFQRASATLDGCVKIYLSRVESAASETGKLLSGLAKKKKEGEGAGEGGDGGESDDEDGEGGQGSGEGGDGEGDGDVRKKRKFNRIVESTLVEFDAIRIKKLEQELAIDPLFKKALAEFDEGGAKSLLLNTLNVDTSGRVVFDATSNPMQEVKEQEGEDEREEEEGEEDDDPEIETAISSLKQFLFKDEEQEKAFQELTICPSLGEFQSALSDVNKAKSILSDFNTKMNAEAQEHYMEPFTPNTDNNDYGFDDELNDFGGLDFNDEHDNEHKGDNTDPFNNLSHTVMQTLFKESSENNIHHGSVSTAVMDQDLMAYFDDRMKSNWRGPEHWKVSAFKKAHKIDQQVERKDEEGGEQQPDGQVKQENGTTAPRRRKPENVIVDFFSDDFDEDDLFEPPKNSNTINKKDTSDEAEYKLPDDIRYNSARLTNLFTKPNVPIMHHSQKKLNSQQLLTDENYFADQYKQQELEEEERERLAHSFHQAECEDFDNDFGDVGIDFNDALEADPREAVTESQQNVIGKRRPEYVNFSRVAKRVDVKLLKDNLWKSIQKQIQPEEPQPEEQQEEQPKEVTFGSIVKNALTMYNIEQAKDLSTSFCFICVLHLANEHNLEIKGNDAHDNLTITGF
ncbi:Condensin complex subunit 2 [Candida viswanathii]|uniref:Condensin complex subunit 2 n=1 Tax=Candida viswanathii TaxID=5486 RepID=A0A367XPS3_9ASCO|nr:Condensin complex subunit 2 [Candida viswanathii]